MYVFPIPRAEKIALGRVLVRWYFSLSLPGLTNETFLGVSGDNLSIFFSEEIAAFKMHDFWLCLYFWYYGISERYYAMMKSEIDNWYKQ